MSTERVDAHRLNLRDWVGALNNGDRTKKRDAAKLVVKMAVLVKMLDSQSTERERFRAMCIPDSEHMDLLRQRIM